MAAVLEYLTAEILELSGNAARDEGTIILLPSHIYLAIRGDKELNQIYAVLPGLKVKDGESIPAPAAGLFGGAPAAGRGGLFGSPASATAPPFVASSSPFGAPPAGGVLFGSPASATTSPFTPAPAASSVFGPAPAPPPPTLVGSQEAATASSFGAIAASAPEPSVGECVLLTSLADEL